MIGLISVSPKAETSETGLRTKFQLLSCINSVIPVCFKKNGICMVYEYQLNQECLIQKYFISMN